MESFRLPRFKRAPAVAAIRLTERDRAIIRLIHRHRFLRSRHITALLGGSKQQVLRRLQLLYHHGYLERPRAQINYYHQQGARPLVYGLGNKGAALLAHELDGVSAPLWGEKNRAAGRMFLAHALLVSDVMVAIELACRASGHIRLIHQDELATRGKRRSFQWRVNIGGGVRLGVVPDRVFGLEYPDANGDKRRAIFFLEADRGTMPVKRSSLSQTSFFRKLLAYEATWAQGVHRSRLGIHRFRVLTVTTSAARVQSLVAACAQLQRGHGLFLFADQSVLEKLNLLDAPVWQTGRPAQTSSLITQD